ncbi:MAG: CbiQ family ECF transporter T component [Beijerinckiaceae bacterium]
MIGGHLYPPGWLHRVPAGLKLLALAIAAMFFLTQSAWWIFILAIGAALAVYASLGSRALKRLVGLRALLPLLAAVYLLQWLASGHAVAAASAARLVLMIMLADLVTMTTTTQAMLDALTPLLRPFERFGVNAGKLALGVALVVRFVPVLFDLWNRRREAWRARTGRRPSLQLVKLFLADTLRLADTVAEALDARGYARGVRRRD